MSGLERELQAMGLPEYLAGNSDWSWDDAARQFDRGVFVEDRSREETFAALRTDAWPAGAVTFLVQVLGSGLERESAAAAAAIWVASGRRNVIERRGGPRRRWYRLWDLYGFPFDLPGAFEPWGAAADWTYNPDLETPPPRTLGWSPGGWQMAARELLQPDAYPGDSPERIEELAAARLSLAMRSEDPITRQLAMAALARVGSGDDDAEGGGAGRAPIPGAVSLSTIIHGTWGWKGDWWRPSASFHDYVRQEVRANIYSRGAPFSWSGAYSDPQRRVAAEDFRRWAEDQPSRHRHAPRPQLRRRGRSARMESRHQDPRSRPPEHASKPARPLRCRKRSQDHRHPPAVRPSARPGANAPADPPEGNQPDRSCFAPMASIARGDPRPRRLAVGKPRPAVTALMTEIEPPDGADHA